jgi:hypothetical protein
LVTGAILICVGNVVAISINSHFARPQSAASASAHPRPAGIKAIAATQLSLGTSRLFALDEHERLWSCSVGGGLICHWTPVLQPKSR